MGRLGSKWGWQIEGYAGTLDWGLRTGVGWAGAVLWQDIQDSKGKHRRLLQQQTRQVGYHVHQWEREKANALSTKMKEEMRSLGSQGCRSYQKMEDREKQKLRTGLVGIFQVSHLSSWPRVVTEQGLAGFCCERKPSEPSDVIWDQSSQISLQLLQMGCLCSNVLPEHETKSKFKLSRVPKACRANPWLWQGPEQILPRKFTLPLWISDKTCSAGSPLLQN